MKGQGLRLRLLQCHLLLGSGRSSVEFVLSVSYTLLYYNTVYYILYTIYYKLYTKVLYKAVLPMLFHMFSSKVRGRFVSGSYI